MGSAKYLIAKESDYRWGAVISTIGIQETPIGEPYPHGEHPKGYLFKVEKGRILHELQILYIMKGRGWVTTAHCSKTELRVGDALIIFPGEWHSYAPDEETGWTEAWIGFRGDLVDRIMKQKFFDINKPVLRVGISDTICNAFNKALEVAREEKPAHQQQLAGFAALIVCSIYAKAIQQPYKDNPETDYINLARKYMRENLSRALCMEDVAQKVGMGYSKFRRVFRNYTGFPPAQYFLSLKLEKAKDYLSNTHLSSKEIAFRLGFDSAAYFNKMFRQRHGITPQKFREQFIRV